MLRLAALGFSHEANTFAPRDVDTATVAAGILRGAEILGEHGEAATTMSGYLAAGEWPGVDVVPVVMATLVPAGRLAAEALETIAAELTAALAANGPFDGVLAALHGAAVADNVHDVDGYLLHRLREVVGDEVPIGVALDLHANISAEMCAEVDVLNTYRTNPHLDAKERAEEVGDLIVRTARQEIRPAIAFEPLPAVINILRQGTDTPPMSEIMTELRTVATQPDVLSASVAEGYPYADVPEMGMSVVVVTDGDRSAAGRYARSLGRTVWDRRAELDTAALSPAEAIARARKAPRGPVLLLDVGDNIGGGSPGDSSVLVSAARQRGLASMLAIIVDPESVTKCVASGLHAEVGLSIGATTVSPLDATATVVGIHDGVFDAVGPTHGGTRHFDAGTSVAVQLDTGQTVILTSEVVPPFAVEQISALGLELSSYKAIVAKGVHAPLAAYGPHVTEIIPVDTPGITAADLSRFTYRHRRRPLYPFEGSATYREESGRIGLVRRRARPGRG